MIDFIKRLKQCIRWFLQLEANYVEEQEKIKKLLELAEKKCNDTGMLVLCSINVVLFLLQNLLMKSQNLHNRLFLESMMKAKEDELNSIIMELRKNLEALQSKFAKEEVERVVRALTCDKTSIDFLFWIIILNCKMNLLGSIRFFG